MYDYNGEEYLSWRTITKIEDFNDVHIVKSYEGRIYIYNDDYSEIIQEYYEYDEELDFEIKDNEVNILNNGNLIDTYK